MAIIRRQNWKSQQRVDVPHLKSIESAIAGDFDVVVGRLMAGSRPLIVRGFTLSNTAFGIAANEILMLAADSIALNVNATEAGSFLWIPSDRPNEILNSATNGRVTGSFVPNTVNFVGIDFERTEDVNTTDLAQFLVLDTLSETPVSIPMAKTLNYRIVISAVPFSTTPNLIPIAKVTTDNLNKIASVADARPMAYRLGSGGDYPNSSSSYSWLYSRQETTATDAFSGGDKGIWSDKEWRDAIMTRVWELGGGANWYSPTADRNVRLIRAPGDAIYSGPDNFSWSGTDLLWKGLSIIFDNANTSTIYYNTISNQLSTSTGLTNLAIGECIYVDLDRSQNATLTAQKAVLQQLGTPVIPGSRFVIAWRSAAGDVFTRDALNTVGTSLGGVATISSNGAVRLSRTTSAPSNPVVISDSGGTITAQTSGQTGLIIAANAGGGNSFGLQATATGTSSGGVFLGAGSTLTITQTGQGLSVIAASGTAAAGIEVLGGSGGGHGIITTGGSGARGIVSTGGTGAAGASFQGGSGGQGAIFTGGTSGAGLTATAGTGGDGGQFTGNGAGNGITVSGGGSGLGIWVQSGDIQVPTSNIYKYSGSITAHAHGTPHDALAVHSSGTYGDSHPNLGPTSLNEIRSTTTTGSVVIRVRLRIPAGATVTGIKHLFENFSAAPVSLTAFSVWQQVYTSDSADYSASWTALSGGSGSIAAASGPTWITPSGAWTSQVVVNDGFVEANLQIAAPATSYVAWRGCRLTYTYNKVSQLV